MDILISQISVPYKLLVWQGTSGYVAIEVNVKPLRVRKTIYGDLQITPDCRHQR